MKSQLKAMVSQRLVRGTRVVVADSFGKADLRGKTQVVASKGPVKCNKKGRCAGDWCIGLAVFTADVEPHETITVIETPPPAEGTPAPEVTEVEEGADTAAMGWRSGTTKICLTHLRDTEGNLILPPPAMRVAQAALETPVRAPSPEQADNSPVTWEELAQASNDRDLTRVVLLARRLKRENEGLYQKLVDIQERLIDRL